MFFQKNLLTGETPEYSQALQEVSVQDLQSTPAESGSKKKWFLLILVVFIGYFMAPDRSRQNFNRRVKSNVKNKKMDFLKKNWLPIVAVAIGAVLMFTDKGKRMVETVKIWFK